MKIVSHIAAPFALSLFLSAAGLAAPPAAHADGEAFLERLAHAIEQVAERRRAMRQDVGYGRGYGEDPRSLEFDVNGNWVMANGNVNRIHRTYDGLYVTPVGRGNGVHYLEIGPNLYQDADPGRSGTYQFIGEGQAVWSSNDRRDLTIMLYRR